MATGNVVRNTQLAAMLKAAEKAQCSRMQHSVMNFQKSTIPRYNPVTPTETPSTPGPKKASLPAEDLTPTKTLPPAQLIDLDEIRTESIPFTLDEIEFLERVVKNHSHPSFGGALSRLVDHSNTEPPERKKKLFLQVRCRRCSAGAKGGVKREHNIDFTVRQWQWLENVQGRCKHASIGKTLRIIVDFYMPLCEADYDFEQNIFRAGRVQRTERMDNACKSVDPAKGLAIRGGERCSTDKPL